MNAVWLSGRVADLESLGKLPNGGRFLNFVVIDEARPNSPTSVRVSAYGAEAAAGAKILREGGNAHIMGELRSLTVTGRLTLVARQIAVEDTGQ